MIKAGSLLLGGALLTACGSGTETVGEPTPQACASPPAAEQTLSAAQATNEADCFLAGIVVPAGAHRVTTKSLPGLTTAPQQPACTPLIDQSRFWTLTGTTADVQAFLRAHPAAGMTISGYSAAVQAGSVSSVSEYPTGSALRDDGLALSVLDAGQGMVDIRADGQVIPAGAVCSSGGGSSRS